MAEGGGEDDEGEESVVSSTSGGEGLELVAGSGAGLEGQGEVDLASVLMPPPPQPLPPGCPSWAARLKNCEVCPHCQPAYRSSQLE